MGDAETPGQPRARGPKKWVYNAGAGWRARQLTRAPTDGGVLEMREAGLQHGTMYAYTVSLHMAQ